MFEAGNAFAGDISDPTTKASAVNALRAIETILRNAHQQGGDANSAMNVARTSHLTFDPIASKTSWVAFLAKVVNVLVFLVTFVSLVLFGFSDLYIGNPVFGSGGILDYLRLFLWAVGSGAAGKGLASLASTRLGIAV